MTAPVKQGLYYFLASSGIMTLQYLLFRESLFSTIWSLVTGFGLAILFIVLAIKEDRNDEPGYSLADAVKAGMICFAIGSLLSAMFTYILFNIVDPSLITEAIEYAKEVAEKALNTVAKFSGMDDAKKAEMFAEMEKQEIPNPFTFLQLGINWVIGLIFPGIIIALISGAIMKND